MNVGSGATSLKDIIIMRQDQGSSLISNIKEGDLCARRNSVGHPRTINSFPCDDPTNMSTMAVLIVGVINIIDILDDFSVVVIVFLDCNVNECE